MPVVLISRGDGSGTAVIGGGVIDGTCNCGCGGGSGTGGGTGTGTGGSGSGTGTGTGGAGTGTGGSGSGTGTGTGGNGSGTGTGTGTGGNGSGTGTGGSGTGTGTGSGTGTGTGDGGSGSGSGSGSGTGTGTSGNSGNTGTNCTCNTGTSGPNVIYVMPPPPPHSPSTPPPPPPSSQGAAEKVVEVNCNIVLTEADIENKYLELPDDCEVDRAITLTLENITQTRNEDWVAVGNIAPIKDRISWAGMGMGRYAQPGDTVSITYYKYLTPPPPATYEVVEVNCNVTLTQADVENKYLELPDDCEVGRAITVALENIPQTRNEDWQVVENVAPVKDRIAWAGLGMGRYAQAGDIVSITYYKKA